jgi:tetratricopeptide (TPR) repeat protein
LFLSGQTFACLNESLVKRLKNGFPLYINDIEDIVPGHRLFNVLHYNNGVQQLKRLYAVNKDPDVLSDIGLLLILERRYDQAIDLYRNMEQQYPGRYATASNIGTAFELTGQNDSALKWISRAVAINPKSHDSSEWLHVNILKAKLKEPSVINSNFLLGIDFGKDSMPRATRLEDPDTLGRIYEALYYQLNERITFIKGKDPIVARLLFDMANIFLYENETWEASVLYQRAKEYGYNSPLLEARMDYCSKRPDKDADLQQQNISNFEIVLLSILTGIVLIPIVLLLRMKH